MSLATNSRIRRACLALFACVVTACDGELSTANTGGSGPTSSSTGAGGAAGSTTTGEPCGVVVSCEGKALAEQVDIARYQTDLDLVAHPRTPGSEGWQAVQDLCAERFAAAGYQVELQDYGSGVNVVGTLNGTDKASEKVILSAHYDSVPNCDGADDNGTGTAGLFEAARVLAQGTYSRTLVVACWDQEELGLIGSDAYAKNAKADGDTIAAAFVFEMIGYKSDEPDSQLLPIGFSLLFPDQTAAVKENGMKGDFVAVVGDTTIEAGQNAYVAAAGQLGLPVVSLVVKPDQKNTKTFADLRRSDHASFWSVDYPALMLTDTANFRNLHYHCTEGPDAVADLDHSFTAKILGATVWTVFDTLQAP